MRTSALGLLLAASFTAGCASVDWDAPKSHTTALARPPSESLASAFEAHPDESGFLLLADGIEAFGARLLLASRSHTSLDAQYYFILDDVTGHAFFRELLKAADRGVRVRLLLDDIATSGYDPGLAALDSHPHFEVRIFNPFTRSKGRLFSGVSEFRRVNPSGAWPAIYQNRALSDLRILQLVLPILASTRHRPSGDSGEVLHPLVERNAEPRRVAVATAPETRRDGGNIEVTGRVDRAIHVAARCAVDEPPGLSEACALGEFVADRGPVGDRVHRFDALGTQRDGVRVGESASHLHLIRANDGGPFAREVAVRARC